MKEKLVLKSASTQLHSLPGGSGREQDRQVGSSKAEEEGEEGAYEAALRICRDIPIIPGIHAAG